MKKETGNFKKGDYVICLDDQGIAGITINKIYIVHKIYINSNVNYIEIKNDNYLKYLSLRGLYKHRFTKATKKEINDNLVDIITRKLKNEI